MTDRISRFTVPDLADVPEDVRPRILAVQDKAGSVDAQHNAVVAGQRGLGLAVLLNQMVDNR